MVYYAEALLYADPDTLAGTSTPHRESATGLEVRKSGDGRGRTQFMERTSYCR